VDKHAILDDNGTVNLCNIVTKWEYTGHVGARKFKAVFYSENKGQFWSRTLLKGNNAEDIARKMGELEVLRLGPLEESLVSLTDLQRANNKALRLEERLEAIDNLRDLMNGAISAMLEFGDNELTEEAAELLIRQKADSIRNLLMD